MAGPISSFYAQVGISTRIQDLRKVDRYLKHVETKLKRFENLFSKNFSLGISSFFVNERSLKRTLGNALDKASKDVVFEVSRFAVNERNLRAAMLRAGRSFAREAVPYQSSLQRPQQTVRERPQLADRSGRNFMYGGGTAGALARYGVGSVPFIGGAYGLMQLNTANQEAISTRLTTQAVLQAQGFTEKQGEQAFQWLRNLANLNGFSYMQAAPDYNQFLSNALGAGVSLGGSQDIFRGFSEYQTAMGVTPARRKLINNALSQMLGKGTVSMEELRRQMAESMPGTMSIFAEALARQTGSGLTGQAALAALYEAVPSGKVKAADILPIVSQIMSERAAPKIGVLRNTSMAQQARMGNAFQDWINVFSKSGGEEGFARFFSSVTTAIEKLTPVVKSLSEAFNWLTKQLEAPLLVLGDLGTHFENLQTTMNALHPDAMKFAAVGTLLMTSWGRLAAVFSGVFLVLEDISAGVLGYDSYTKDFFTFLEKFVEFDKGIMGVAMAFLTVAAAIKLASKALGASLLYDFLKKQSGLPGDTSAPDAGGNKTKGKTKLGRLGWLGPIAAAAGLAAFWGMNEQEFSDRMGQNFSLKEESSVILERLFGGGLGAIGRTLGTGGTIPWHQRDEYSSGLGRQWESPSEFLDFKKQQALYGEGNGQSDIPSVPNTPEQAMAQMGMIGNTSNTITNTFEIKIDGVIDPANMENIFNQEILPQIEGWWTNQLGEVDISYGSK